MKNSSAFSATSQRRAMAVPHLSRTTTNAINNKNPNNNEVVSARRSFSLSVSLSLSLRVLRVRVMQSARERVVEKVEICFRSCKNNNEERELCVGTTKISL